MGSWPAASKSINELNPFTREKTHRRRNQTLLKEEEKLHLDILRILERIETGWLNWMSESYEGSRLSSSSRLPLPSWSYYFQGGRWKDESVSAAQSQLRVPVITLIVCGLQLLRCLRVGLNNTSTGLRLTAWPTAGIILTITQEQEEETVWTSEPFREVTLHAESTTTKNRDDEMRSISKTGWPSGWPRPFVAPPPDLS